MSDETFAEEQARLERETAARDAEIAKRVQALEDEGFGDNLHGALAVLMNPKLDLTEDTRRTQVVNTVLGLIAVRELDKGVTP